MQGSGFRVQGSGFRVQGQGSASHFRANPAHTRQTRPDHGLGLQVKSLKHFKLLHVRLLRILRRVLGPLLARCLQGSIPRSLSCAQGVPVHQSFKLGM